MKGTTPAVRKKEIVRRWYLYNAEGEALGRLSVLIAKALMGKGEVNRSPYLDSGHFVVVINAGKIKVTGGKEKKKIYYRYTGYPGGLRQESYAALLKRRPEQILRRAIFGMLPANKLRAGRLKRLFIYPGDKYSQKVTFVNQRNENK